MKDTEEMREKAESKVWRNNEEECEEMGVQTEGERQRCGETDNLRQ